VLRLLLLPFRGAGSLHTTTIASIILSNNSSKHKNTAFTKGSWRAKVLAG